MLTQAGIISEMSDLTQRFNKKSIYQRSNEDIKKHIEDICQALEVIEYIDFLGCEIEDDESKITRFQKVNIDTSRLSECTIRFKINYKDESTEIERKFFIPKLVDDYFFYINNVTYFPIWQIVDKGVFVTPKLYSLKTLLMPIRFMYKRLSFSDINENELEQICDFKLNLFKQKINFLYYFFAEFGIEETVEYMGYTFSNNPEEKADLYILSAEENDIREMKESDDPFFTDYYWFNAYKNIYIRARKEKFNRDLFDKSFLYSFIDIISTVKRTEDDIEVWKRVLGKIFTKSTNTQIQKAEKVLFSLRRILDERTKRLLSDIEDYDKEDIYAILRWMLQNFSKFQYQDNMDLVHKRIQCWEYLLQPLLRLFSNASYRILNTRNLSLKTLTSVFNIGSNFLIKKILNNELIRYNSCVNNIDLFGACLKITFKGAGGISDGSDIADRVRKVHKSYIGQFSLISTSAGEPGLTTTLTPFTDISGGMFHPIKNEKINN